MLSEHNIEKSTDSSIKKDEVEIDLLEILHKIFTIRKILYKAAIIGLIIGLVVGFSLPKKYTVGVTLSPEMGNDKSNGALAGLAASFLGDGITGTNSVDALNISLSSDIVSSTPFLLELLEMQVLVENKESKTLSAYLEEDEFSPWWSYVIRFPGIVISGIKTLITEEKKTISKTQGGVITLAKEENEQIKTLKKNIIASVDKKTAITNVFVTMQDPLVAAVVADSVVNSLQEYIINYRTTKAKEDCLYLEKLFEERRKEYYAAQKKYANYVDAHDNLILQSVRAEQERLQNDMNLAYQVYSQVANQLQVARAKVQEVKPVFAVVEPAVVPLFPSSIGKMIYMLLFAFITVCGTMLWILLGKDLLKKYKKNKRVV